MFVVAMYILYTPTCRFFLAEIKLGEYQNRHILLLLYIESVYPLNNSYEKSNDHASNAKDIVSSSIEPSSDSYEKSNHHASNVKKLLSSSIETNEEVTNFMKSGEINEQAL